MNAALGFLRVLQDIGFILYAGTMIFWVLVWPQVQLPARLVRLVAIGIAVLIITTVDRPALHLADGGLPLDQLTGAAGAIMIIQLAALVGSAFFLPDLVRSTTTGRRLVVVAVLVVLVAVTLSLQSGVVAGRWAVVEVISTSAHVLATSAWFGGLAALLVLLRPGQGMGRVLPLVPAFSRVRLISVVVLIVTGIVQVFTTAGASALLTRYGVVLLVKVVLFAAVLVASAYGRTWVARVTFRAAYVGSMVSQDPGPADADHDADPRDRRPTGDGSTPGDRALAVVLRAEVALALVIVAVTSVLVGLTPVG